MSDSLNPSARQLPLPPLRRVTIYCTATGWQLDHADDPSAASVRALFGSTVLPLPFSPLATLDTVATDLETRHPGVAITFRTFLAGQPVDRLVTKTGLATLDPDDTTPTGPPHSDGFPDRADHLARTQPAARLQPVRLDLAPRTARQVLRAANRFRQADIAATARALKATTADYFAGRLSRDAWTARMTDLWTHATRAAIGPEVMAAVLAKQDGPR